VANQSTIGPSVKIKGEIGGSENLIIEGEVEGLVTLPGQTLTIGPSGQLKCDVDAKSVVVHGNVIGNLHASDLIEVKKNAKIDGELATHRLIIEDGASVKVRVAMNRNGNH
jgi:cytoskeletal protein CcmA (bactofilin family)